MQFKTKKSTPLRKLMDAYCSRLGVQSSQVQFIVNLSGERIGPEGSAEKLGLEDEDLIDVAMSAQLDGDIVPEGETQPRSHRLTWHRGKKERKAARANEKSIAMSSATTERCCGFTEQILVATGRYCREGLQQIGESAVTDARRQTAKNMAICVTTTFVSRAA